MSEFKAPEGWERVTTARPFRSGEPRMVEYDAAGDVVCIWVRETPVPSLPTAPYTVIRVTWKVGGARYDMLTLSLRGLWEGVHITGWTSEYVQDRITSFEVLSEPRAVTAKAVLDRIASEPWAREIDLTEWRREFGVTDD